MKKYFIIICALILICCKAQDEKTTLQFDRENSLPSPEMSFIGIDSQSMADTGDIYDGIFDFLEEFNDAAISNYGDEKIFWYMLEPDPPINHVHTYNWQPYDEVVIAIEKSGGDVIPTIWSVSPWATGRSIRPSSKPLPEYEEDYRDFIREFVERYDGDGYKDMGYETPNDMSDDLNYAHNYIQIEDEAENLGDAFEAINDCGNYEYVPSYFRCAADAYGKMLKLAYEAAHEANPNAKVISFTFNFGETFDENPVVDQDRWDSLKENQPHSAFLDRVFSDYHAYFDVIGVQGNYNYAGFEPLIEMFNIIQNEKGINKPLMIADASCVPLIKTSLSDKYYDQYPYLTNSDILEILVDGDIITNTKYNRYGDLVTYPEIRLWWEAQKAATIVKKAILAANLGMEYISFQFMMAPGNSLDPWTHSGLLGSGLLSENDGELGTPRIAVYALKQLNGQISDFQSVANINPVSPGENPEAWPWIFEYLDHDDQLSYVIWSELPTTLDLSDRLPEANSVTLTSVVTGFVGENYGGYEPDYPEPVIYPIDSVPISTVPGFVKPR